MKKLMIIAGILALVSFQADPTISKQERKNAAGFLKESEKNVMKALGKLSEAQLKYKPAPDKWSIQECMMHIAASEKMMWSMTDGLIKGPATPAKRADIKVTDEQVSKMVEDRTKKVKTGTPLEPQNTGFRTIEEAVTSFREDRGKLIDYVKNTNADLRNHVTNLPFGAVDAYQLILFIGAHSNRHVLQMKEVMADPGFPKK